MPPDDLDWCLAEPGAGALRMLDGKVGAMDLWKTTPSPCGDMTHMAIMRDLAGKGSQVFVCDC